MCFWRISLIELDCAVACDWRQTEEGSGEEIYKEKTERNRSWMPSRDTERETKTETNTYSHREMEGRRRHIQRDREQCWMCVLHPKGSLTQYRHSTGGQSTTRVHWPKSLLFTLTYTHTIPPSNIPVSTRPLRITALTEVERRKEWKRMIEWGVEGENKSGGMRRKLEEECPPGQCPGELKQSVYCFQRLNSAMLA